MLQAKYTSVPIFGRNIFAEFDDPPPRRVRREVIRTLSSFSYNLRKFMFDAAMAPHGTAEFVRTPLISLEYIAAFYGYISLGYRDGLDYLCDANLLDRLEVEFLEDCASRKAGSSYEGLDAGFAVRATEFLDAVHGRLLGQYRRRGVSDIRWDGRTCARRWDLELPQAAAMGILRTDDQVLLLHRPADDYLYPDLWTIPGGYLNHGELPVDAAARELTEETGSRQPVAELFDGQPLVSPRLAAFAFEVTLPGATAPRLTEHSDYKFVDLADVLAMDLTPEARLVLERYVARGSH